MKIYIPSYRRAGKVLTHELFKDVEGVDVKIVIPKSQYKDYKEYYDDNLLYVIEDSKDGNVAKKRNAILDIIKQDEGYGIIADDDIKFVTKLSSGERLSPARLVDVFENLFSMANDVGAKYVGLANNSQPIRYTGGLKPFSFTKIFYCIVGVIEDGIRYDEQLKAGEDTDFYYKQVLFNTLVVRDNRFYAEVDNKNKDTGVGIKDKDRGNHLKDVQKRWGKHLVELHPNGTLKAIRQARKGV